MERAAFGEALVDANNDVLESDETNNTGYVAIPTPPPICTPTVTSTNTPTRLDTSPIDGTPMATTAGDGRFTVGNLTPGDYRVSANHLSYLSSEDDSVACQPGQTTVMPDTTLLAGDANDDRVIDLLDLVIIGAAYGACSGEPTFDRRADINATGYVELLDLVLAAINFRRSGPTPWGMTPTTTW
jgi:hypothetical protein